METKYQTEDLLTNDLPEKPTGTLKTLTTLTFIGCAYIYITTLWGLFKNQDIDKQVEDLRTARDQVGEGFMAKWMDASIDMVQRVHDYRWINLLSTLLFTTLCLVGAMQMRKLKKQGFNIYVIGQVAPLLLAFVIMGVNMVSLVTIGFLAVIALVFILLYAGQRKYMH